MLKRLAAVLIASTFAFTAFAQAPKSDTTPATPSATTTKKDQAKHSKKAKGNKKAKHDPAKAKSDAATK